MADAVTKYSVYQSKDGAPQELVAEVQESFADLVITETGSYNWQVSASNLAGEGPKSSAVFSPTLPTPPANLEVTITEDTPL